MEHVIRNFSVRNIQILDENGNANEKDMPKLSPSDIKKMYEWMILIKSFDDRCLKMQRQGRLGTYAPMRGQEACQVGSASLIEDNDIVFPAFRENGVFMMRGTPAEMLIAFWAGDERGMQIPKKSNMFPVAITVGAHLPHAVGAGMAFQYQKKKAASIVYFGDGATSEGDFHESLNFAGVFKAPVVFICQNNQWAISVPVKEQTASATLAQKALAYGFEGIKVDGNDVFAVYKATKEALEKARSGKGPTLIECFTYRLADHTTSDDSKKYRTEAELKEWIKKDPIERLKKYMIKKKLLSKDYESQVLAKAEKQIDLAVQKAESMKPIPPEEIFNYIYEKLTPELEEQQARAAEENNTITDTTSTGKGGGVVGELEEAK